MDVCFRLSGSHAEEEDRRSGGKKKIVVVLWLWTSHVLCHAPFLAKFLVCLATKIVHSSLK